MSKKVVKSISTDPIFYSELETISKENRITVSALIDEALKQVFKGEKSVIIANILSRGVTNGKTN